MQVGDILHASYQYASKHNYYYEVVKRTPKSVTLRELRKGHATHDGYGQNGTDVPLIIDGVPVPNRDQLGDEILLKSKRVQTSTRGEYVKIGDYISYARVWDGTPQDFYTD